ncbi:hypothetical protein BGZ76_007516 [Entomortierella beljakovae]|nr:hypothetical protein BGZ76_007516 [Entomortierella beljakovae]
MSTMPVTNNLAPHSKRVLELYRQLLKIGKAMPTETRSSLVLSRVKADFRANKSEQDPKEIENMIQLAEVQIDNLEVSRDIPSIRFEMEERIQKDHLTELSKNPNLIIPVDIHKNAKPRISRFMKGPPLSWELKAIQEAKDKARQQGQNRQQQEEQQQQQQQDVSRKIHHGSNGHNCKNHRH